MSTQMNRRIIKLKKPSKTMKYLDDSDDNEERVDCEPNAVNAVSAERRPHLGERFAKTREEVHKQFVANCHNLNYDQLDDNFEDKNEPIDESRLRAKSNNNEMLNEVLQMIRESKEGVNGVKVQNEDIGAKSSAVETTDGSKKKKGKKKRGAKRVSKGERLYNQLERMAHIDTAHQNDDSVVEMVDNETMVEQYMNERNLQIKVKYKGLIEKFDMKSSENFFTIMPAIAKWCAEEPSKLVLRLNDYPIDAASTPKSIGLSVTDIIECQKKYSSNRHSIDEREDDPNVLTFRLKDKSKNAPQVVRVSKYDFVLKIMEKYSKVKSLPVETFSLRFDGEPLNPETAILELDIEDQSQIDVIIK